jgi:molecular chaperone Hsp33
MAWHVLAEEGVFYNCSCSKQRLADAFICLGEQELQEMQEEGQAEARCHFCNETYYFTKDDLQGLLEKVRC